MGADPLSATSDTLVARAEREARTLRHDHVGTEHVLLAVLAEPDEPGARALANLGVTLAAARAQVMRIVGLPDAPSPPQLPLTPAARDAFAGGLREAIELGRTTPGPEHVLLALLRERDGVAVRVLADAGVDAQRLRQEVRAVADQLSAATPREPEAGGIDVAGAASDRLLGGYALLGVLAAGGPAAELLRARGVDEAAIAELLRGS